MSRDRPQLVMRFFHVGDRPNFAGARLAEIRILTNHLNLVKVVCAGQKLITRRIYDASARSIALSTIHKKQTPQI